MVGILIISHGSLAEELLSAGRKIDSTLAQQAKALSLEWNVDPEQARQQIAAALRELDAGDGVIVLTDMFGGTPTNLSLAFLDRARSELVTGVNLPMVVKVASLRREPQLTLKALARAVAEKGQKSIYVVSEVLERKGGQSGEGGKNS
ncbi:MAG: PTS sugar transporter subunit IIA [Thermoanaerobaculum sp.]|nr:PTS sugar transporter subunit IIA [Thermoanaerobaculum sp.]